MLITNSGVVVRRNRAEELTTEQGTLVLWKWLALARFFPPDRDTFPAVLRGNASVSSLLYFMMRLSNAQTFMILWCGV